MSKTVEKAACMGPHYEDPNKIEFVIHRKQGPERYVCDVHELRDYIEGKTPFVEFARTPKK